MVNLREGQFAIVLLVELTEDVASEKSADLPEFGCSIGLTLHPVARQATAPRRASEGLSYRLKTYSSDQPGTSSPPPG